MKLPSMVGSCWTRIEFLDGFSVNIGGAKSGKWKSPVSREFTRDSSDHCTCGLIVASCPFSEQPWQRNLGLVRWRP